MTVFSFLLGGDAANIARTFTIAFGGSVVGAGSIILIERARFYRRLRLPRAVRAMYLLIAMNALVLTYIALGLIGHWGDDMTYRVPLSIVIFAVKAWFFLDLRHVGMDQERRILYGGPRSGAAAR
jgi:hypothetical protein